MVEHYEDDEIRIYKVTVRPPRQQRLSPGKSWDQREHYH